MMKKTIASILFLLFIVCGGQASANLNDTRASVAAEYGDYRMVVDTDGQLWTKAEWEAGGSGKAKPGAYVYYFTRKGVNVQMEVLYEGTSPDARVKSQRFTPDVSIKIKDFKDYFPECYLLVTSPKAKTFGTYKELTRNFRDQASPVTLGVVVREVLQNVRGGSFYTLLAFNIKDAGRLVKDTKYINSDLYIHEFTIERVSRYEADDGGDPESGHDWEWLKNPFR